MTRTLIYGIIALVVVIIASLAAFLFTDNQGTPTEEEGGGFFESLFPFGANSSDTPNSLLDDESGENGAPQEAPQLQKISADSVSGAFLFERDERLFVRFIDRGTGHLFEVPVGGGTEKRITNTTIPGIQEVFWINENELVVRYLEEGAINTFVVSLDPEAEGEQSLSGGFTPSFTHGTLDPQRETIFAVYPDDEGARLALLDPATGGTRTLLTSPISSWLPLQSSNGVYVYPAPTFGVDGSLYQISSGALNKLSVSLPGLTANIHPNGRYALIGAGDGGSMVLDIFDLTTNESLFLILETLPEKCVFVPGNTPNALCGVPSQVPAAAYPDDWLLGRISLNDNIWLMRGDDLVIELVADLGAESGEIIDVWQPQISDDGQYLLFMNKRDLSLWLYRLSNEVTQ